MKKILTLSAILLVVFTTPVAFSAPNEHLDWGAQLHSGPSACPTGKLVINVVQKIINDNDSGIAGNAWAYDDFVRQITIVEATPGTFCATVKYQGNFTTIVGPSPGNTGVVGDGIVGTFQGGYVSTLFTGTLLATPLARTRGSIGTFDYDCDTNFNCPGYVSWITLYFSSTSGFDYSWWGWVYHAGNNGSWTNASSGNSGDITGN